MSKQIFLFICTYIFLFTPCTKAQRSKQWGAQVNEDMTITVRLRAPEAKAVYIKSTFDKAALIKQVDSIGIYWMYTTSEPVKSDLHTYVFIVDGQRILDPENGYSLMASGYNYSVLIVPGDPGSLYRTNDIPQGTVSRVWYHSTAFNRDQRMVVYTPPGYELSQEKYPVLYLLHGSSQNEELWPGLGRAAQIMDNLIVKGKVEPMIVVMPNGNVEEYAAAGEDSKGWDLYPQRGGLPNNDKGLFEEAFPEIIAFVDKAYRTVKEKTGRAIAGLSMGGTQSYHISRNFPDFFDYIGLFSAVPENGNPKWSPIFQDYDKKLYSQFVTKKPKLYWIGIGTGDPLYDLNAQYRLLLNQNGYKYAYVEVPGGHDLDVWRYLLVQFAPLLFK